MYSHKVTYTNHQNSFSWPVTGLCDRIRAAHEQCLRFDDRKRRYRLMRHRICSEWVVNGFRTNTIRKTTRSDNPPGTVLIVLYFQILILVFQKWSQGMKIIYSSLKSRVNASQRTHSGNLFRGDQTGIQSAGNIFLYFFLANIIHELPEKVGQSTITPLLISVEFLENRL